jgi:hypothetical protein
LWPSRQRQSNKVIEQGLCQAHNKLIFLAFSVFRWVLPIRIEPNLTAQLFRDGTLPKAAPEILRNLEFCVFDL